MFVIAVVVSVDSLSITNGATLVLTKVSGTTMTSSIPQARGALINNYCAKYIAGSKFIATITRQVIKIAL